MSLRLPSLLCALLLTLPATIGSTYIEPDAIDVAKVLPPPPADDSPAGLADLETVRQVQAERSAAELGRVTRVAQQTVFTFAAPVLGAWFTPDKLPRTAAIFKKLSAEGYAITVQSKRHWTRDRPYLRDRAIVPYPRAANSPSYPSGHSSDAATWARLLGEVFPEHRGALLAQVRESMWCRVLAGVHYPSDTTAGEILGDAIARKMLENPATVSALNEIRRETTRARDSSVANSSTEPSATR